MNLRYRSTPSAPSVNDLLPRDADPGFHPRPVFTR